MTKINKLVLHGFKSFAKYTEVVFGDKFNCVLGPNGSGKSNILDSLTFVLGKSGAKSMRAEKSSNLIYNGGKSKKPSKHGEVSIYFDNSKKTFPTKDKEVKITRIVRQNGQSIYKINNKTKTRQEIIDLLSIARINPDGYNIILQGDIVKFVEMHPNERRQLVEEISGISVYEEKKRKAMNELEKVDTKLKETEIVLGERNTYLKELKKDRDQALKYKDMEDKININKASYVKLKIDRKDDEKRDHQKNLDKNNEEFDSIKKKIDNLKEQNQESKQEVENIAKEIEEKGEVEQVKLNKDIESRKIELTKNQARIDTLNNEINRIKQRKTDLLNSNKEVNDKVKDINKQKEDLEKKKALINREKSILNEKITKFKQKNKLDNLGEIEKKIDELDKEAETLQKQMHELREQQHKLIREKDIVSHDIKTIDEKIKKVVEVEKEHKQEIQELKNRRQLFKQTTLELNKRLDESSNVAAQLAASRQKLVHANEQLAKLNAQSFASKEVKLADIAVKKILEQKNKKRGIYGTVADLGNTSSKYALALEVAAGTRIKSIVVEDDKMAAELIKYLKTSKLGTATFLPLNKIRAPATNPNAKSLVNSSGCYGFAIDLVSFDTKFKKIFEYVLKDTLIVDNIEVARRLGIGKARYVTLDGDVAEFSGVMQGGYRQRKKQGIGFKENEITKDISEYGQVTSSLQSKIKSFESRQIELEETITKLRGEKANLEGEIIKTEKSLHLESGEIDLSKKQKSDLLDNEKEIEKKIREVQNNISSSNKQLATAKIEKEKLRGQISQLRNPLLVAELNSFEEKTRQFNEQLIKADANIKNIGSQVESIYGPEQKKTNEILKQLDSDDQDFIKEKQQLTETIKDENKDLQEMEKKAKAFYSQFKGLFNQRTKITEMVQKNDNQINKLNDDSRKVEIRINTFSLKMAEINAELSGLNQEFAQYEGVKLDLTKTEEQYKREIAKFEKLKSEIGFVNMRALEIYEDVEKQYNSLLEKKDKLGKEKADVEEMMAEIEAKKKDLFLKTFEVVNDHFKKFFSMLSTKGEAYLEVENQESPFEAGLRIKVKISGQKFMDIRSLSGGEKTMTALAFIFAIQEHDPASFYVLDEVDAALDKHNSEKLAKMVRKYADRAQYVIISHNDGIISEADNLYGISMNEHGISKCVSLKI